MSNQNWFKKQKQQDEDFTVRRIVALIIVFVISVILCSFPLNIVFRSILNTNEVFCTQDDSMIPILRANGDQWINAPNLPSTPIKLENDRRNYYPKQYRESSSGAMEFIYIMTGNDLVGLQGSEGYIYLPADEFAFKFWLDYYWITRLETNIYCYKIK